MEVRATRPRERITDTIFLAERYLMMINRVMVEQIVDVQSNKNSRALWYTLNREKLCIL
jgi:hypothetical protein